MSLFIPHNDHEAAEFHNRAFRKNAVVVVCFTADWCGACKTIAPLFEQLSNLYKNSFFIKVDVDKCPTAASKYGVKTLPTFIFMKKDKILHEFSSANSSVLKLKADEICGSSLAQANDEDSDGESMIDGFNLKTFIDKQNIECLNSTKDSNMESIFSKNKAKITSDADEQLILYVKFNQFVKMTNFIIRGPKINGPKLIKLFVNLPSTPSFDECENTEATQEFELTPEDLMKNVLSLKLVRFQKVNSVAIFVANNQDESDATQIDYIGFVGTLISTTNMTDFKRVTGKAGEAHS